MFRPLENFTAALEILPKVRTKLQCLKHAAYANKQQD